MKMQISYWKDDTWSEVVTKECDGLITFCDGSATFEEAGRLYIVPGSLMIMVDMIEGNEGMW